MRLRRQNKNYKKNIINRIWKDNFNGTPLDRMCEVLFSSAFYFLYEFEIFRLWFLNYGSSNSIICQILSFSFSLSIYRFVTEVTTKSHYKGSVSYLFWNVALKIKNKRRMLTFLWCVIYYEENIFLKPSSQDTHSLSNKLRNYDVSSIVTLPGAIYREGT